MNKTEKKWTVILSKEEENKLSRPDKESYRAWKATQNVTPTLLPFDFNKLNSLGREDAKKFLSELYTVSEGYKIIPTEALIKISEKDFDKLFSRYLSAYEKNLHLALVAATKDARTFGFVEKWLSKNPVGIQFFVLLKAHSGTSEVRQKNYDILVKKIPDYMQDALKSIIKNY